MLTNLLGTALDNKMLATNQTPAYQILLWSRWQDTDSDIILGAAKQTPIDLTDHFVSGTLVQSLDSSSSLSATISMEKLNLNIFSNCIIQLREGAEGVDIATWPTTFTGWRLGQPGSTESAITGNPSPEEGGGPRGEPRTVQLNFVSRENQFTDYEITSDGVWLPNARNQTEFPFVFRDDFDDIGKIAQEVAINADWGMGLQIAEVLIPKLPYRIEKQLQFVQIQAWESLKQLLQVLHRVPDINGEGKLVERDRSISKPTARTYTAALLIAISQPDASFKQLNAVVVKGLAKDITEVLKKDQKLTTVNGTFGFFDPKMEFSDTWGQDRQETWRVKVGGAVIDGNGRTVATPRIRKFEEEGFIPTVDQPVFTTTTEFGYKVEIENDTLLILGLLAALIAGYVGAMVTVIVLTPTTTTAGSPTTVNFGAVTAQIAGALLLVGGIFVLQAIGNFSFEIWGVPFETVYEEIRVDAILEHFGTVLSGAPFREWERKDVEITNYILSTEDDSAIPADLPTEPAVTNPGVRTFAKRELAIRLAEQAKRQLNSVRDILLEPADIILDERTGFRYFIKSITRNVSRGEEAAMQSLEAFRLPPLPGGA